REIERELSILHSTWVPVPDAALDYTPGTDQGCEDLRDIPNGLVEAADNCFGTVARYSCDDGYQLTGDPVRVCQGDETWSGAEPHCLLDLNIEKVACGRPPEVNHAVHNGYPDKVTYELGTMLQYECLPDFTATVKTAVRAWCVGGGVWVGPSMTCTHAGCPHLEEPENGWVNQEPTNTVGSRVVFHCNRGYFLSGRAQTTCLTSGSWDSVPPSCEKEIQVKTTRQPALSVMCAPPPELTHATHDEDPERLVFPSGYHVTYTCAHGYRPDGEARAVCSGDGEWIALSLLCSPQSCGFPGDVLNGWRTGYAFTFPHIVNYYCHEGFELQGVGHRVCGAEGEWSGQVPTCKPVTCPTLFAPVYGKMFECNDSYRVLGSKERRCQADRTWTGETTKCQEINCGWPTSFYNGLLIGENTLAGSVIFYSCKVHATFEGDAFQTRCLETGEWSEPPPLCWGQCQVPNVVDADWINRPPNVWVNHNTSVEFRCKTGLRPRDGLRMRCNNGTWTSTAECLPAPCESHPPHVHNGMRVFLGNEHGHKAKYSCFPGYRLYGVNGSYLQCHYGDWVGGRPHCEEHRLVYKCNVGFQLSGAGGATCVNGEWQPPIGDPGKVCVPARHPPAQKLWIPTTNIRA
ncbi:LEV9-like protein, partial [Mya arenaria]